MEVASARFVLSTPDRANSVRRSSTYCKTSQPWCDRNFLHRASTDTSLNGRLPRTFFHQSYLVKEEAETAAGCVEGIRPASISFTASGGAWNAWQLWQSHLM